MLSKFIFAGATLVALSGLANAQTNITEKDCASTSEYSKCNRDVADKWSSCLRGCNGNGNCAVDCGCQSHQKYINCMAESCWNQVCYIPFQTNTLNTYKHMLTIPRSTPANTSSSSSNTSPSAPAPKNQSPSGHPQPTPQTAAPVI
jgi:hypothetical protein